MDVQYRTISEDSIENIKDLLHRPSVVFVTCVKLGEGVNYYQCWPEITHYLDQIGGVIRVVDNIQAWANIIGGQDDEIPHVRRGPKGGQ